MPRPPLDNQDSHVSTESVEAQAAAWLLRTREGLSLAQQAEFDQWLQSHPAHNHAWVRMQQTWRSLDQLRAEDIQRLRDMDAPRSNAAHARRGRPPSSRGTHAAIRRRAYAMAAMLSLIALVGVVGWHAWQAPVFTAQYDTARGQQRQIELPEGSHIVLDTDSHIEVTLYRDHRDVRLLGGQAMFEVAHDAARPFQVDAAVARVTVLGTRFAVRRTTSGLASQGVSVAVEQGHVRVQGMGSTPETAELLAGQGISSDDRGQLGSVHSNPHKVAMWRDTRVSFNDTPLAVALAEFERYGDTRLVIDDPVVASMRITGSFDLKQPASFANALIHTLPLRLRQDGRVTAIAQRR
jgi:transmembrane sensor